MFRFPICLPVFTSSPNCLPGYMFDAERPNFNAVYVYPIEQSPKNGVRHLENAIKKLTDFISKLLATSYSCFFSLLSISKYAHILGTVLAVERLLIIYSPYIMPNFCPGMTKIMTPKLISNLYP